LLNIISGTLSSGTPPAVPNSYESIATVTVGSGGSSTVSFTSIPSTYKHLQVRGIVATTASGSTDSNYMITSANNDTNTSNYYTHYINGNGSSAASGGNNAYGGALYSGVAPKTNNTNMFGGLVIDILDYSNTSKNKTFRTLTGADLNNTNGILYFSSAVYLNTAAITSLTFSIAYIGDLARYSSFALYGIKGA